MNRFLLVLVCSILVLFSGLVHGIWSDRWQSSHALDTAQARVPDVPLTLGSWQGESLDVDATTFAAAGAQAYWMRRYHNSKTGQTVSVILMCGRGGRMSVHTPDVCYQGAGYDVIGVPKKLLVPLKDAAAAEVWTGSFAKGKNEAASQLRLYWTWTGDGTWQAPEFPRFTFRGQPALYKLYVIRQVTPGTETSASDPALPFLQELLPQLNRALFSAPLG